MFAVAVSVALLFGAGAPALAASGKGKAKGHEKTAKAPKPKKNNGDRVNGGGTVGGAAFSVQARNDHPKKGNKGHFNYTREAVPATATAPAVPGVKVRCKSVTVDAETVNGVAVATVSSVGDSCTLGEGPTAKKTSVVAKFYDKPAGDQIEFTFGGDSPADVPLTTITEGSIKVRVAPAA
jgi:hypothetical protein